MFTDAMIDAAAESLAVVWFERQSQMCTVGLPIDIRRQIKQITKDMFIVAEKWKDIQVRDKPFLSIEDE